MHRRTLAAVTAAALALGAPAAAVANDCVNIKRKANDEFAIKGQWVNVGGVWLFVSPGTDGSDFGEPDIHFPAAKGNFTNGKTDALINQNPNCVDNPAIKGACGEEDH